MKKQFSKTFFGKAVMAVLAVVIVMATVCLFNGEGGVAYAAADNYFEVEPMDNVDFTDKSAPILEGKENYIFAGYYEEETCETPVTAATDKTVYAKFVSDQVLSVKAQLKKDTTSASEKTNLRLVSSVDSLNYSSVGFKIYYNGAAEPIDVKTSTVYERIVASTTSSVDYNYGPKVVDTASKYFVTATLVNINNSNFGKSFYIKPYWKTLDGTTVYGEGKFLTVNNGLNENNINITVKTSETLSESLKVTVAGGEYDATVAHQDATYAYLNIDLKKNKNTLDSLSAISVAGANTTYRNLLTKYTGTADTTWYTAAPAGTTEFVIMTSADLYGFAELNDSAKGKFANTKVYLGADITVNEGTAYINADGTGGFNLADAENDELYEWDPIGEAWDYRFQGVFDGNGHIISGIYLNQRQTTTSAKYLGLFGTTHANSTVRNFELRNSYFECVTGGWVTGGKTYALLGSVVGQMGGNVDTVYSDAIINSAAMHVGGIVSRSNTGSNSSTGTANTGTITNCWFAGKIYVKEPKHTTDVTIGGVFGRRVANNVIVKDCLNTGEITYKYDSYDDALTKYQVYIGGVAGALASGSSATCCVNAGTISIQACWDSTISTTKYNAIRNDGSASKNFAITSSNVNNYTGEAGYLLMSDTQVAAGVKFYDPKIEDESENGYWMCRETSYPVLKSFCDDGIDFGWYYNNKTDGADTFVIETAEELYGLSYVSQNDTFRGDTIQLGANIKMNIGEASVWANAAEVTARRFVPICKGASGAAATAFEGTFDGKGHEVSGIYVYETANAGNGFFSQSKGTIKNLKLTNSYIVNATSTHNTGSIVGNLRGGSVSNVYSDAIVKTTTAKMATGGIVGIASVSSANSTLSKCWFDGEVYTNGQYAGGIVGRVLEGTYTLENCLNTGDVDSEYDAATAETGGIVGAINNTQTTLKNCLNTGEVTATAETNLGSVVGQITKPAVFENVYTTVNVGGTIVGVGNTTLSTTVTGSPMLVEDLAGVKGYINTDFNFTSVWAAVEGKTPVIKSLYRGEVISDLSAQRVSTNWYYNVAYYNKSFTSNTSEFTIQDVADFYGFAQLVNGGNKFTDKTITLVENGNFNFNPDMTVTVNKSTGAVSKEGNANKWSPIGTSDTICFDGTFDGNGNILRGVYVDGSIARQGLFGTAGSNSTIKNFTIENSYYKSSGSYVASVAAVMSGNLEKVYIKDNVGIVSTYTTNNTVAVGGLVGIFTGAGTKTISNCWYDGSAIGAKRIVGGIAGQIYSGTKTIDNCLVTGNVFGANSSTMFLGGLVGAIMGPNSNSPTVYLKNSIVTGLVKSQTVSASGSVVGRSITATNASNPVRVTVYHENVYTTDNLVIPSGTTGGYHVNGYGDMSYQYAYIYGEPMVVSATELAGIDGYVNTKLSFDTATEEGAWVVTEDGPRLASFTQADVTDLGNTQRKSISFMYNSMVYNETKKTSKTNKAADQQCTTFMVKDASDMYGFALIVNDVKKVNGASENFVGKTVKLANDIIFNNVSTGTEAAGWADGSIAAPATSWVPIGTEDGKNNFQGTFDGDGHSIAGLYVASSEEYLGLFRKVQDATICNLNLVNSYFVCTEAAGSGSTIMGSIAGGGDGTFENIYTNAIVKGQRIFGGMIGRVSQSSNDDSQFTMKSCWFDGVVDVDYKGSSRVYCGGLIGYPVHGNVTMDTCLYTGSMTVDINYTGTGTTFGPQIGGLCSGDNGDGNAVVVVKNCISAGSIHSIVHTGTKNPNLTYIGSILGQVREGDSTCVNTFALTSMTDTKESTSTTTARTQAYYGSDNAASTVGVDTSYMSSKETLYGLGAYMWTDLPFTVEDRGEEGPVWAAVAGQLPVPATLAENPLELVGKPSETLNGSGTEEDPWQISTIADLAGFAQMSKTDTFKDEYVVLTNDIIMNAGEDASSWVNDEAEPTLPWIISIGYEGSSGTDGKRFEGTFDGQGYTISGLCFENASKGKADYVGLFATTEAGSTVKNLRFVNSYIEQTGTGYTGAVIGDCRGNVSNVYSDAIVKTSSDQAGGIVGRANGYDYVSHKAGTESRTKRTIDNCWYDGDIILVGDARYGGGIAGILIQGEWTFTNCVFTGTITAEYAGTSHGYLGGICGATNAPGTTKTSTMESTLKLNSCISAGTIVTQDIYNGVGAIVGRLKANIVFDEVKEGNTVVSKTFNRLEATNLVMNNVFATREVSHQEVGAYGAVTADDTAGTSYSASPTITGKAVWTNNADRLVGYCTEEVKDGHYVGGKLNFTNDFVIREEGVPVPAVFADMDNVTQVATSDLNTIFALNTMDSTWSTEKAVNYGLGHYVLTATGKTYDNYTAYLAALEAQGFTAYTTLEETGTDGVYNVIYTKVDGEWVLNVLFVQNTGKVTLTISNGFDSLSPDLEPEANITNGDVTVSMLQLEGSGTNFTGISAYLYKNYYYGNSFVFKLPNGHFVINDGGNKGDMEGLMKYLKKEAGLSADDTTTKIYIDAWTVTHQHSDHFGVMNSIVSNPAYAKQLVVSAVYMNEPNQKAMLCFAEDSDVMNAVKNQYRGIRMLKDANGNMPKVYWCQTGQTYYFDGLTMTILQSQEQIPANAYGKRNKSGATGTDYNTSTTNMLFTTANGKKVLITGDSNYVNMEWMMNAYGASSQVFAGIDVYQVMHHGKNTSYNISSRDNTFTDYIASKTTSGKIEISLFPCSVFYDYSGSHDPNVFPAAGSANEYLIENKTTQAFNYGEGTIKVTLSDTITAGLDTSVDTGTEDTEIEEEDTSEQ